MKAPTTIALLLFSVVSMADGPTTIHGFNDFGELFIINHDGEVPTDPPAGFDPVKYPKVTGFTRSVYVIEVNQHGERGFEIKRRYRKQDCGWGNNFTCSAESDSPLAGAVYAVAQELPMCGGTLIACTSGCGPRAPLELIVDPWECGEEEPSDCLGSGATRGFISANDVNVRDQPTSNGTILRTVPFWTKVEILKRSSHCIEISKRHGRWALVNIHDNGQTRQGWIFDAYIANQYLSPNVSRAMHNTGWDGSVDQRAFRSGDITAVKRIMATKPKAYSELNGTALSEAVSAGQLDLVRYLSTLGWLQQCAHSQFCDSPLLTAALNGDVAMTNYLLSQGFTSDSLVFHFVTQSGEHAKPTLPLLVANSAGNAALALNHAAHSSDINTVKRLCEAGADPDIMLPLDGRNTTAAKELAWDIDHTPMVESDRKPLREILQYFESGQCKRAAARNVH